MLNRALLVLRGDFEEVDTAGLGDFEAAGSTHYL